MTDSKKNVCPWCGGEMVDERIDYHLKLAGQLFIIEDVPCISCNTCEEKTIRPSVHEEISRRARNHSLKQKGVKSVPIMSLH